MLARLVRSRGLEPPRVAPLAPQASASTNSATTACGLDARPKKARASRADVTASLPPDKGQRRSPLPGSLALIVGARGPHGRNRTRLVRVRDARQEFFDFNRDPVAADDHRAFRYRHIVGENADLIFLRGIELDDGAAAEAEYLVDRHRGFAQNHGDVDRDIIKCRQGALAQLCRHNLPAVMFHHGMVTRWLTRAT